MSGGLGADVTPAAQHLGGDAERDDVARPGQQVDRDERRTAHRVDVGQRVGGGDPTPVVGVVDDGREEVGGRDDGAVSVDAYGGRVVAVVEPDEQVATGLAGAEPGQHPLELAGRDLARAAAAGGVLGESHENNLGGRP
jgi:hypothetical protein